MSINDVQGIRELFESFELTEVLLNYNIATGNKKFARELIVS
jgi:hypothetical protein